MKLYLMFVALGDAVVVSR